jgi:hypothetical protein
MNVLVYMPVVIEVSQQIQDSVEAVVPEKRLILS